MLEQLEDGDLNCVGDSDKLLLEEISSYVSVSEVLVLDNGSDDV
jgi:hypothetical protein